jgi:glutaryl-CoA dehydrogenase (non-decarboxylating)
MNFELTPEHKELRKQFREFADKEICPIANDFDREGSVPEALIQKIAAKGYLGATIPIEFGGLGMDQIAYGLLNEEIGRACSSTRSLVTVHSSLVSETILRWGTKEQKEKWLPLLSVGKKIAALGLSEPETGSDAKNIVSAYEERNDCFILNGTKKWITFAQRADVFVIIARENEAVSAFIVEKGFPGLEIVPLNGMLGTKASMVAEIHLKNCKVPKENLLGRKGMGFLQIVNTALDNGRYSVACGSLGIALACLEDSIKHAKTRKQFGVLIKDHQLIKQKIANMITGVKAARLLCYNAGWLRLTKSPNAFIQTSLAKYFASKMANESASEAVQLHGALGCHDSLSIQRYFRDAKIMEIIEGSSEIQQIMLSDYAITSMDSILES